MYKPSAYDLAEIQKSRRPKSCRESRRDLGEISVKILYAVYGMLQIQKNIISYFSSFWFQIKAMLSLGYKAEIQALSSISFEFLTDTYLPVKIKHGRWI